MSQETVMFVSQSGLVVRVEVKGRLPARFRRTFAQAIYRRIKPVLADSLSGYIYSRDTSVQQIARDFDRKLSVFQAPRTSTRQEKVGYRIRMARLKTGLTQVELAAKAGITASQLSRIEQGRCIPYPATFRRLLSNLERAQTDRKFGEATREGAEAGRPAPKKRDWKPKDTKKAHDIMDVYSSFAIWQEEFEAWLQRPEPKGLPPLPPKG